MKIYTKLNKYTKNQKCQALFEAGIFRKITACTTEASLYQDARIFSVVIRHVKYRETCFFYEYKYH